MIMMILDYLNNALEVNSESKSVEKQIVDGKWGDKMQYHNYDAVLEKLKDEVKTWSFMYRKGTAKYEFEDSNSATFFLSYSWSLLKRYASDLEFV